MLEPSSKLQYPPLTRRAHEMPQPHGWHDEPAPSAQDIVNVAQMETLAKGSLGESHLSWPEIHRCIEEALKKLFGCPTEPQP